MGGKEVRGSKVDLLHCSEVAFWGESGNEYLLGVLNTVVQGYQTEAFLESTANGVGGVFYERWKDAEENPASGWAIQYLFHILYFQSTDFLLRMSEEKQTFKDSLGQDPFGVGPRGTLMVAKRRRNSWVTMLSMRLWKRHCDSRLT